MRSRSPDVLVLAAVAACAGAAGHRIDLGPVHPGNEWLVDVAARVEAARAACTDRAAVQLGVTIELQSGAAPVRTTLGTSSHRDASPDALMRCLAPRIDAVGERARGRPHVRCFVVVTADGGAGPWLALPPRPTANDAVATIGQTSCWTREWRTIEVYGEVAHPGTVPYRDGMTVRDAIIAAGGRTPLGAPRISVIRGRRSARINLGAVMELRGPNPMLAPGDVLFAPAAD